MCARGKSGTNKGKSEKGHLTSKKKPPDLSKDRPERWERVKFPRNCIVCCPSIDEMITRPPPRVGQRRAGKFGNKAKNVGEDAGGFGLEPCRAYLTTSTLASQPRLQERQKDLKFHSF